MLPNLLIFLYQVLSVGDDQVGLELLEDDPDDIARYKTSRSAGSMSAMSGAKGMVYMEYKYGFLLFSLPVSRLINCSLVHSIFRSLFILTPFVLFIVPGKTSYMVRKKPNQRIHPRDTIYLGNASASQTNERE